MKKAVRIAAFSSLLVLILLQLSSCSIEKRRYSSGYNIQWHHQGKINSYHESIAKHKRSEPVDNPAVSVALLAPNHAEVEPLIASTEKTIGDFQPNISRWHIATPASDCDNLIMKNGEEIKVKIEEVRSYIIRYRKCDDQNGPIITVNKSDVYKINYANGTSDVFFKDNPSDHFDNNPEAVDKGVYGPLSLGLMILGFALGSIPGAEAFLLLVPLALVLALIGVGKHRKNKGFAITTIVLFFLTLILGIILFLALMSAGA
ncbi:MAG: hypothetical protein WCL14_12400 [Bacteroidota bacterium]